MESYYRFIKWPFVRAATSGDEQPSQSEERRTALWQMIQYSKTAGKLFVYIADRGDNNGTFEL